MTVNELLLELMRLTLEGKGNFQVQAEFEDKWTDIERTSVIECVNTVILE